LQFTITDSNTVHVIIVSSYVCVRFLIVPSNRTTNIRISVSELIQLTIMSTQASVDDSSQHNTSIRTYVMAIFISSYGSLKFVNHLRTASCY